MVIVAGGRSKKNEVTAGDCVGTCVGGIAMIGGTVALVRWRISISTSPTRSDVPRATINME